MKNKAFPISMTVLWGMVFGSAMHSLTMGICMGLMMGVASACSIPIKRIIRKKSNADYITSGGYDNERAVC